MLIAVYGKILNSQTGREKHRESKSGTKFNGYYPIWFKNTLQPKREKFGKIDLQIAPPEFLTNTNIKLLPELQTDHLAILTFTGDVSYTPTPAIYEFQNRREDRTIFKLFQEEGDYLEAEWTPIPYDRTRALANNILDAAEKAIPRKSSQPPLRSYFRKPKQRWNSSTEAAIKEKKKQETVSVELVLWKI